MIEIVGKRAGDAQVVRHPWGAGLESTLNPDPTPIVAEIR